MKNTATVKASDVIIRMADESAANPIQVDGKQPSSTVFLQYTVNHRIPKIPAQYKGQPIDIVLVNREALEHYVAPIGRRMLITWKDKTAATTRV